MTRRQRRLAAIDLTAVANDGYTTTALLGRREVRAVRRLVDGFGLATDHGFFASPAFRAGPEARAFDLAVRDVVSGPLTDLLPDHEPFMIAATTKGRRSDTTVKFHQDWTYTDERVHRPLFLWCPLVDVDERNGTLMVVPGSHRWSDAIRPSRRVEVTEALQVELAERAVPVALSAGHALVFDPAVLHGSDPNPTARPRPAFTIALAPSGAELVHFHLADDGTVSGATVDDAFFTAHPYGTAPTGYPARAPWTGVLTLDHLTSGLRADVDAGASR